MELELEFDDHGARVVVTQQVRKAFFLIMFCSIRESYPNEMFWPDDSLKRKIVMLFLLAEKPLLFFSFRGIAALRYTVYGIRWLQLPQVCSCRHTHLGRQRWDVLVLQPARLLIAVQGEQHHSKPDMRRNSRSTDLAETSARDEAMAAGANKQQLHVLWLLPGRCAGRKQRWRSAIQRAMADASASKEAKLHKA